MRTLATLAIAIGLCAGSAAQAEPLPKLPPYTAAYQPQGVDERGIWERADEEERKLRDSKGLVGDPALRQYVRDVLCRAVGNDRCGSARIYIARDADFNAWMAPNGMMVVNTGLLLRTRDEAELAAVLGHEFAHFELRHSLLGYKRQRSAGDAAAWVGVIAAGAATYGSAGGYNSARDYRSIQISIYGGVYANNRDQERQADLMSMAYMGASPYDPGCFADIWGRVMDEADASARGRKQRSVRYDRVAFFSTHPTQLERTLYLRDTARAMAKKGVDEHDRYDAAMATWRLQFLGDQLKLNDFEGTDYLLAGLAGDRWTAPLLYSRGELYRMRGNPRDLVSAVSFYSDAIAQDPASAEAYRGMGLAQLRNRDPAGTESLRKYLTMKPDASDRAMISTLLQ